MKRMKRILAILLAVATIFAFIPAFENGGVYAGDGTDYGVQWVRDSIKGLRMGYAVAEQQIYVDKDTVMENIRAEYGSQVQESEVKYTFYCDYKGYAEALAYGNLSDDICACYVPNEVNDDRLWLEIVYNGYYYDCSHIGHIDNLQVICVPNRVDSTNYEITKDMGSKTFTFSGKGSIVYIASNSEEEQEALLNTLYLLEYNAKVDQEDDSDSEYNYSKYDLNRDGVYDFALGEYIFDEFEDYEFVEALTDYSDSGIYKRTFTIPEGMPIPQYLVGGDEYGTAWPYYSQITFVFPTAIKKSDVTAKSSVVYTGKAVLPSVTVKVNGKTLTKGTSYKLSGSRTSIGPGTVTVTGIGKYTGTVKKSYSVLPGKVTIKSITGGSKQFTVKWGKKSGGVRYQIKYRVKGTSTWSNATAGTATSKTIKGLKKGKTYEVKVRAYKTVSGKNYYGAFSTVKTVKVK